MKIDSCIAREIADSRGKPTIEVELRSGDLQAVAGVPSGKSTGSHEAKELRDEDGRGVSRAIGRVNNEIAPMLMAKEWQSLWEIDEALVALDGTQDKSRLGSNGILGTSMAAARLFAQSEGIELWQYIANITGYSPAMPRLFSNVLNGGVHADMRLPFQEYMLVVGAETAQQSLDTLRTLFIKLGEELGNVPMGDEGGYSPTFDTIEKPFDILSDLIAGDPHVSIAIDAAASEFYKDGAYQLLGKTYPCEELLAVYKSLTERYPLTSIEDPFAEDDFDGFAAITAVLGNAHLIVGDDLTVTNVSRIENAIEGRLANALLVKPNQIGTITETLRAIALVREAGWKIIVSHRSGETMDTFIADLAYGVGAYGIKAGGLGQKERLEKYERLLEIEK
ncbi:MAG TPA: enolase C-terminal domain-like protein [Candidatus Paceibacterota bacterium]